MKELLNSKQWPWFWLKQTGPMIYMLDYVNVTVKLKARLLKPSIILPLGNFLAGSHHLKMVLNTFAKDQHGMQHKDLEHKDKQNFEAVSRINDEEDYDHNVSLVGNEQFCKTTAVWLFQECEKVSTDHLFRTAIFSRLCTGNKILTRIDFIRVQQLTELGNPSEH